MDTLNMIILMVAGFVISALLTGIELPFLRKHQLRQYIREEGPESHQKKSGTPTMGGVAMVISIIIVALFSSTSSEMIIMIVMMVLFSAIGFIDDFIKIAEKHNTGLLPWQKIVLQVLFAVILAIYVSKTHELGTMVYLPIPGKYVDFGWLYVPFVAFVLVAMANSVNLTDGLDGLCGGVSAIVAAFFAVLGMSLREAVPGSFAAIVCGVCVGFLLFNHYPAKIFMGDTGSMALGGAIGACAIMMKMEFMLVIAGFIYVIEALSVIIQVLVFKKTGRRVFRMTPIHHHFELGGMKETQVVLMFYGISVACCILAYAIYAIGIK
ncbi:MAG: phospho-N-acetylmuramoyl-pentapeptide-transferase [Eubacterium sp.]|jgi:phospho-N-acetylmuramoyl-pentapeptide-transferase